MRSFQARQTDRGYSVLELCVVIAIIAVLSAMAVISIGRVVAHRTMHLLACELQKEFRDAQARALAEQRNIAFKFTLSGSRWSYRAYADGNGNGVRNADIAAGVDRPIGPPRGVWGLGTSIAIPAGGVPDPVTNRPIPPGTQPVRFNSSTLCSFGPDGGATPGTLFLSNGFDAAAVVINDSGTISARFYDVPTRKWSE